MGQTKRGKNWKEKRRPVGFTLHGTREMALGHNTSLQGSGGFGVEGGFLEEGGQTIHARVKGRRRPWVGRGTYPKELECSTG